ncbi:sodium:proton antiporter NhaD [Candidatus Berkiella cookevillensis]|uniref:Na(+)/H(+) antiporter NhaD n=1 Tax=Candidatus Berkiella cookevillensis TaxID=437022 RepID=A0A0Q9YVQ9_9GAMM|nr:sodium:proton antiporter NhaD [Candidatus Berkiella cookevillensis]MCS5708228.1 sodium:proton antiporter NhaD [Candidatus Berkiella cookevillensis]
MTKNICSFALLCLISLFSTISNASESCTQFSLGMTDSYLGILTIIVFIIAYFFVMSEEFIHLRKSKPILLASGLIWIIIALMARSKGVSEEINTAIRHNLLEYSELLLFLLVAMTYVNAMEERKVFEALRSWLVRKQFSYRKLFWITGLLAFFISPVADNLTTALIMCAVVMAVGADKPKFILVSCINIVVAANAGGAFSPFGDITTLMVWQKGYIPFHDFFKLFVPAVISFVIPAFFMQLSIANEKPPLINNNTEMEYGALGIVFLFFLTIITAVAFHNFLHLPPATGMMTGLSYLFIYSYFIKKKQVYNPETQQMEISSSFDIFRKIQRTEWDTLLFFYGVILCVGGLATIGYLDLASNVIYNEWGSSLGEIHKQTPANIIIGILSAIIDNIPIMFAVITMEPSMSEGQWLLVTLTAGIGGSLLSIGSAAGVALMGQAKGAYTFFGHLKWTWAIALGYFAAIGAHLLLNGHLFEGIVTLNK